MLLAVGCWATKQWFLHVAMRCVCSAYRLPVALPPLMASPFGNNRSETQVTDNTVPPDAKPPLC